MPKTVRIDISCLVKRGIIGGGTYVLCAKKKKQFDFWGEVVGNGSCLPTALPLGFLRDEGFFWLCRPQESA